MSRLLGRKTIRHDSVTSTNDVLKKLALDGVESGTVVTARIQTAGKGRLSRKWESQDGGLWMSVLLETDTDFESKKFGLVPLMAGSAVATAVIMEYELDAGVKWPNDVLIGGRKVCGILCELVEREAKRCAVVGIGVNVNNRVRKGFEFSSQATSLFEELGRSVKPEILENTILEELDFRAEALAKNEFSTILDDWRSLSVTLGKDVIVHTPDGEVPGKAQDIDENGALILVSGAESRTVNAGDCQHLD